MEVPSTGEIVSFRVKKRRLGGSYDELCETVVLGVPDGALTRGELDAMEIQYEDRDGDMLVLTRSTDLADVVSDAQALFVSRRTKKAPTRINQGPRALTERETEGGVLVPLPRS